MRRGRGVGTTAPGRTAEVVHPVPLDAVPGWLRCSSTAFLHDPTGPDSEHWTRLITALWDPERSWGGQVGERWVATLRTEERGLTVPGPDRTTAEVRIDALTAVTVAASHRRRGLLRRMLTESLTAARERGDALSGLIAAEWAIYGRFGYAPATFCTDLVLHRARPGCVIAGDPSRVASVDRAAFAEIAPAVFAEARSREVGHIDRSPFWWNATLGLDGFQARADLPPNWFVHEGDDGPDGLLAWSPGKDVTHSLTPPLGGLDVWGLVAAGEEAYRDLWSYLSGIDGVDEIRLGNRPVDEPARWLLADGRALETGELVDFLWLRILDVPRALAARAYTVPGELVLEVIDEDVGGFAAGRFRVVSEGGDGGGSSCEVARSATPDLTISQRALSSIYLGGVRLLALPGGAVEHTPGALAQADLMFSTARAPWNATGF